MTPDSDAAVAAAYSIDRLYGTYRQVVDCAEYNIDVTGRILTGEDRGSPISIITKRPK